MEKKNEERQTQTGTHTASVTALRPSIRLPACLSLSVHLHECALTHVPAIPHASPIPPRGPPRAATRRPPSPRSSWRRTVEYMHVWVHVRERVSISSTGHLSLLPSFCFHHTFLPCHACGSHLGPFQRGAHLPEGAQRQAR